MTTERPILMSACSCCGRDIEADDVTWPVEVGGQVIDGGCQMCWEEQCSESWWHMLRVMGKAMT